MSDPVARLNQALEGRDQIERIDDDYTIRDFIRESLELFREGDYLGAARLPFAGLIVLAFLAWVVYSDVSWRRRARNNPDLVRESRIVWVILAVLVLGVALFLLLLPTPEY